MESRFWSQPTTARRFGYDRAVETEFGGFLNARGTLGHGSDSAGQRYLAEIDRVRRQRRVDERGDEGSRGGKVRGGFLDAHAARDIEIDIVAAESHVAMGLEYGQHHRQPARVPANDRASRCAERGRRDQCLDFDEQGARTFDAGKDGRGRLPEIAFR